MPPYFFLSCAQADDGPAVQRFFRDLSNEIRVREKLPDTEIVGCSGVEHFENRDEGLRTSRMMLALISPNYLRDHAAESDWHTFERRKARITRINWSRHYEPLPQVLASTPVFPQQLNGNRYAPLAVMIAAIGKYKAQYAEFVNNLADYIIASAASPEPNTFEDREEPEMKSQPTNPLQNRKIKNLNQNFLVIDGAFFKAAAEGIKETVGELSPPSQATEKYLVYAIVHNEQLRRRLEAMREHHSDEFDIEIYDKPSEMLAELNFRLPDLFVVSLDLFAEDTSGQILIEQLTNDEQIRSAIIVIYTRGSKNLPHESDFGGAVGFLRSDVEGPELQDRMTRWARVGRNRIRRSARDQARKSRPVFLSYSTGDKKAADHICYQLAFDEIEVWYAAETLKPGNKIFKEIKAGLATAQIFIALISPNYESSDFCHLELADVLSKKAGTDFFIPVFLKCKLDELKDPEITKWCSGVTPIPIETDKPGLGYRDLFRTIKDRLG